MKIMDKDPIRSMIFIVILNDRILGYDYMNNTFNIGAEGNF